MTWNHGRKQLLRLLTDLERRLQQSGEALSGLQPLPHQLLELRQIGSQGRDQQLDRDCRLAGLAAAADIDESRR